MRRWVRALVIRWRDRLQNLKFAISAAMAFTAFHSAIAPFQTPPRPATVARLGFSSAGVYVAATPTNPGDI
jgi:hypothetical protein